MSSGQWAPLQSGVVSFRSVFKRLPDPTLLLDPRGRVLEINPAAEKAIARSRGQLLGCTLAEIGAASALVRRLDEVLQRVLDDCSPQETMVTLETPRGTFHWEVRFVPDDGGGDEVPSVLGVFRDVTAVVQRHRDLVHRNSELSRLGDSLCHDLSSPMATVRSFVGFLVTDLKARDETQVATDLAMIESAVDKMTELINVIARRTRRGLLRTEQSNTQ